MAFRVYQNTIAPQSLPSPVSLGSLCRLLGQAPDLCLPIKEQHPWASVISSGMAMSPKMGQSERWALTRAGTATVSFLVQDAQNINSELLLATCYDLRRACVRRKST